MVERWLYSTPLGLPVVPLVPQRLDARFSSNDGPDVLVGMGTDPGFVALQVRDAAVGRQLVGIAQRDELLHRGVWRPLP